VASMESHGRAHPALICDQLDAAVFDSCMRDSLLLSRRKQIDERNNRHTRLSIVMNVQCRCAASPASHNKRPVQQLDLT